MKEFAITYQGSIAEQTPIDIFFKCWALVLPVTSVLIFPSIQGTTPAYMMAFLSIPLILFAATVAEIRSYFFALFFIILGYITLSSASQFFLSVGPPMDLSAVPLV